MTLKRQQRIPRRLSQAMRRSWSIASDSRVTAVTAGDLLRTHPLVITEDCLLQIRATIGSLPAETGAALGGIPGSGVVSAVHIDKQATVSAVTYSPDVTSLNRVIRDKWRPRGIEFMGFVHSHPGSYRRPSLGDAAYATRILQVWTQLDRLLLPIVSSAADTGRFDVVAFSAIRSPRGVDIVPGATIVNRTERSRQEPSDYLARVIAAYDPAVMAGTRITAVGVGGSVSFLEDMARAGVGEFVLIDPDVVEPANIGTQHAWPADVDQPKVTVCAKRLTQLNPLARVWTIQATDADLSDLAFSRLVNGVLPRGEPITPTSQLLCAFTDSFEAQARLSRLALHLGVAFLTAAVYHEGRGIEVCFSAPGVTPACSRCALAGRYRAYLEQEYTNNVTSDGTPIYATSRLNALKQIITHGLLHGTSTVADPSHPATIRYRRLLALIGSRNLVMSRLDPDLGTALGLSNFDQLSRVSDGRAVVDDTLWLAQKPDNPDNGYPICPDCGGTGDLSKSLGAFLDTRIMPHSFGEGRREHQVRTPAS